MSKNPPPESSCPSEEMSLSSSYSSSEEEEQQQQLTTAKSVPQPVLDSGLDPTSATKNHDKEGESESHSYESKHEEQQSGSLSKKPQQLSTPASPKPAPKSDSDTESSSDSEHVSESDFETAKEPESSTPVPPKPASDSGYKSEYMRDSDADAAKLEKSSSSKHVTEVLPVSKMGGGGSSSKKASGRKTSLTRLIWTEADEIAVLEGMTAFQFQHGLIILTKSTISDFLTFIKASISLEEIIADQLVDKLKRMKKSYHSVLSRANNKELKFASEHNRIIYGLAKSVWGSKKDTEKADDEKMVKYNLRRRDLKNPLRMGKLEVPTVADDVTMENVRRMDLKREYPFLMVTVDKVEKEIGNNIASMALETVDPEKASILEKKAKKLRLADVKLNMQELDLRKEILQLVMED